MLLPVVTMLFVLGFFLRDSQIEGKVSERSDSIQFSSAHAGHQHTRAESAALRPGLWTAWKSLNLIEPWVPGIGWLAKQNGATERVKRKL